ncbi:MAG: tetratricopeptide repeat protein [Gemmatimonadota bacterium]
MKRPRSLAAGTALSVATLLGGCASEAQDHLVKGNRFLADGKRQDAQAEFRIAMRRSERPPEELLWKLGLLDLDSKNVYAAREELDQLVRRDPGSRARVARTWLLFASRWFQAGDPFNAIQAVEAARAAQPERNLGPLYYEIGDHWFELPDYERAAESYLLALALAPGLDAEATYRLGLALERLGRWRQAVTYYRQYAATGGERADSREVRYRLGEAAFRSAQASFLEHRYAEALDHLALVLEAGQPETRLDDAYYLLGEVRYRSGEVAAAEAAFVRVLELSPSSSSRLYGEAERRLLDIRIGGAPVGESP